MTVSTIKKWPNTVSRILAAASITLSLVGGSAASVQAQSAFQGVQAETRALQPKLKSGRYCSAGATALLKISRNSASVVISGRHPDSRGYTGNPKHGFSGEGFSIVPLGKKTVKITQHQYGITRKFKRC